MRGMLRRDLRGVRERVMWPAAGRGRAAPGRGDRVGTGCTEGSTRRPREVRRVEGGGNNSHYEETGFCFRWDEMGSSWGF